MTRFLLVRHAESTWVQHHDTLPEDQKRFGGRLNDVPLSGRGQAQALQLGGYMRGRGIRPAHYVSSPAKRALQTHAGSQRAMGLNRPATIIPDLQELTWGDWEGELRSIVKQPYWAREQEKKGFDFCPPGGESLNTVRARAVQTLLLIAQRVAADSLVCVHTHQNVIKSLVYPWQNWTYSEAMTAKLGLASITSLSYKDGVFSLDYFNRPTLRQ
jgi:probable phosphoglycerate mutase